MDNKQEKAIAVIASVLGVSEGEALQFYQDVASQLIPPPSLYFFSFRIKQYGKKQPTVQEIVEFIPASDPGIKLKYPPAVSLENLPSRQQEDNMLAREATTRTSKSSASETLRPKKYKATFRPVQHLVSDNEFLGDLERIKEPEVDNELLAKVVQVLSAANQCNLEMARNFLQDIKKIYPKALDDKRLFLSAIEECSTQGKVTVYRVWKRILKKRNRRHPYVHIISVPMGGKQGR